MDSRVRIAPSLLSADFANLSASLDSIKGADFVHFDVMDGHFTRNLTFGPSLIEAVKRSSDIPVDAHLMVENPDDTVDWYLDAGADMVTVHYEAATHLHRIISHIKERGRGAGVVLNPATPVSVLEDILDDVDMVLLMSVNPGFGGQRFIERTRTKLVALRNMMDEHGVSPLVEVDGGVCRDNAFDLGTLGANVLVAGSAVFGSKNPAEEISVLRELAEQGRAQMGE